MTHPACKRPRTCLDQDRRGSSNCEERLRNRALTDRAYTGLLIRQPVIEERPT
jgi:hypothetical protein